MFCSLATRDNRYRPEMFSWLKKVYEEHSFLLILQQFGMVESVSFGSSVDRVPQEAEATAMSELGQRVAPVILRSRKRTSASGQFQGPLRVDCSPSSDRLNSANACAVQVMVKGAARKTI